MYTIEERIEWAGKIRDYLVDKKFGAGEKRQELLALEGEDLLYLFPEPKWFKEWDDGRYLTWESFFFNASMTVRRGRDALIGQRVTAIFCDYPFVAKTEGGAFVVVLGHCCLSDTVSKDYLLEWGLITQEEYDEIIAEEEAAHNDYWTRSHLRAEAADRIRALNSEISQLHKDLEEKFHQLSDIDTFSTDEIAAIQQAVRDLKATLAVKRQEKEVQEELVRTYRIVKGASFELASS